MKSEPGPPMMLGNAAAANVRLIVWSLPSGSHTASPGAGNADIRLSPLRRHFVPPKVAQVPIPPKWPADTARRLPFLTGACGWSVPVAGSRDTDMVVTGERQ
jgi:hypothetical protein